MKSQITRWNPLQEMEDMQKRLATLWNAELGRFPGRWKETLASADWSPRVDIIEEDKEFVVTAELPEMKREDIQVAVEDGVLSISGERKLERDEQKKKYHRIEREYGSFLRTFSLPESTSGEKVTAEFKDGLLKVHLPKDHKAAAKKVSIKVS